MTAPASRSATRTCARLLLAGSIAVAASLLGGCGSSDDDRPVVRTSLGSVKGVVRNGVNEYRGIPYAEPLAAADRWTLARPVRAWSSERDAEAFGSACPQSARFELTEQSLVEDCLTLNVSVPLGVGPKDGVPVLVYVHGGGGVGGSSNLYRLDKLAREGRIVVVSINYRVGALGVLSHPALADEPWNGNLALEDQRLAFRWVQQNIAAFGGDPARVTIAGESAGAGSVCLHLLSGDRTRGLFAQAIATSYGCLYEWPKLSDEAGYDPAPTTFPSSKPTWQLMAEATGCLDEARPGSASELACLRAVPIADLLAAQDAVSAIKPVYPFSPKIDSGPDGTVPLRDYSPEQLSAHFVRVPMLYGGTQDELRLYVAYDVLYQPALLPDPDRVTTEQMKRYFGVWYGLDPKRPPGSPQAWTEADYDRIIAEYFPQGVATAAQIGSMLSDYVPVAGLTNCAALKAAAAFSGLSGTVYQWEFADPDAPVLGVGIAPGKDPRMELGAVHSAELNYLFPNLSNTSKIDAPDLSPRSQALSDVLTQTWAAFVRTGSPRTAQTPGWLPYAAGAPDRVMRFAPDRIEAYDARARHRCAFWEQLDPALANR